MPPLGDLDVLLAEAVDHLPAPRACRVSYGGEWFDGTAWARRNEPDRGWCYLTTWSREVTDGWWVRHAVWVMARRVRV